LKPETADAVEAVPGSVGVGVLMLPPGVDRSLPSSLLPTVPLEAREELLPVLGALLLPAAELP
jgi:hypothetical protein